SMYNNLLPAVALAITALFGGGFSYLQLAGSVVILAGVLVAQLRALRTRRQMVRDGTTEDGRRIRQ
ncbi:MAG: hypothetical protein AB7V13_30085, partial [Pseudorhodoplanes sp.]